MNNTIMNMTESNVKKIVNDELSKFVKELLDKEMAKIIANNSSASRVELVDLTKDALESVYKMLWQKRSFWKADIK